MDYVQALFDGIRAHPYATVIAISVAETRVTAVLVGMFASQGYINPFIAYAIFIVMCLAGDTLYYFIGRTGRFGGTFFIKFFIRKSWRESLGNIKTERLGSSLAKALIVGKITGVISKPIIITAGAAKMPLKEFYRIVVPCALVLYIVYIAVGYFFGHLIF